MLNEAVVEAFISGERLREKDYVKLVEGFEDAVVRRLITDKANEYRSMHYGNKVYIRGLIEFTNYCRNGCFYCGINSTCNSTVRYRLTKKEILECCEEGYRCGFRTFVLQGGEIGRAHV